MPSDRPNFLFIITDQQRADHLGCYGNSLLKTPHIDSIATRGRKFENFYVQSAVCQSNRATILTGRTNTQHGVRVNGIPISLNDVCFTHHLKSAGYATALFGKAHFQNFTTQKPPYENTMDRNLTPPPEALTEASRNLRSGPEYEREKNFGQSTDPIADEKAGDYYGFDNFRICTWHGDDVQGHYNQWLEERYPNSDQNRSSVNPLPDERYTAPQARKPRMPEKLYPTNYITEMTLEYLDTHIEQESPEPFFIQCSFNDPHHPFTPPGKYWDMYEPTDIELPVSFYHQPHDQTPILARMHNELENGDPDREWVRPYAVREDEAKQIIALTYGMISYIDDSVGRLLKKLEDLDILDNTVVVFTSDHGDWMGDHGIMQKALLHYQGLIRVPFIWMDPRDTDQGTNTAEIGCSGDIARTILNRAGLGGNMGMMGQNLLPIMFENGSSKRDGVLIEQQSALPLPGQDRPLRVKTFVDTNWRLTYWLGQDWGEFYDLANDPHEIVNLWESQEHEMTRNQLIEKMMLTVFENEDTSPSQVNVG